MGRTGRAVAPSKNAAYEGSGLSREDLTGLLEVSCSLP